MKKLALLIALLWLALGTAPSQAQTALQFSTCGTSPRTLAPGEPALIGVDLNGNLCVSASVSATVAGFAPAGTFATLTATGSSASVALPAGAVVVFANTGTTAVSCTLGVGSAAALVSENIIQPSSWAAFTVGSNTFGACIDQSGSASNVVVLSGGSGLATGSGGGGGSSGSVTQGTTPWVVDGSGVTQPVSSTTLATAANQTTANSSLSTIASNTGAAVPTTQSGAATALISCDSHVFKHITSATDTLAVQGVTAKTIYVCGWRSRAAGVATWFLENTASTNANCASANTQITGVATEAANTGEVMNPAMWAGLKNTSGNGLCINSTGTGGVDIDLWYTQF